MSSAAEKRKSPRRTVTYRAHIDLGDGSPPMACNLCDVSQDGAQISTARADKLPDEFILALSSDGAARRRCRVIWRNETEIGVKFLKDVRKPSRPARAWMQPLLPDTSAASTPGETIAVDAEPPAQS